MAGIQSGKRDKKLIRARNVVKYLDDPIFNEFLYTVLYEATYEEKRGLTGKYLTAVMSSRAAKLFIQKATEDEKNYILAHFGIKYFRVFVKDNTINREKLTEILKKFEGRQRIESFKDISDAKIFVSSDKTFNRLLGIMAQSMHSPAFFLNQEYVKAGYHMQNWPKLNINQRDMDIREVLESSSAISKLVLAGCLRSKVSSGLNGLSESELLVLLYFYTNWTVYVSKDAIREYFTGYLSLRQHKAAIIGLHKGGYIEPNIYKGDNYTITSTGIRIADSFLKDVMNLNRF